MAHSAGRGIASFSCNAAYGGSMITKGVREAGNGLSKMLFYKLLTACNFVASRRLWQHIELGMGMRMPSALHAVGTDLAQLLPVQHRAHFLPFALQPATGGIDVGRGDVERGDKAVSLERGQSGGRKIGEAIVEGDNHRTLRQCGTSLSERVHQLRYRH